MVKTNAILAIGLKKIGAFISYWFTEFLKLDFVFLSSKNIVLIKTSSSFKLIRIRLPSWLKSNFNISLSKLENLVLALLRIQAELRLTTPSSVSKAKSRDPNTTIQTLLLCDIERRAMIRRAVSGRNLEIAKNISKFGIIFDRFEYFIEYPNLSLKSKILEPITKAL